MCFRRSHESSPRMRPTFLWIGNHVIDNLHWTSNSFARTSFHSSVGDVDVGRSDNSGAARASDHCRAGARDGQLSADARARAVSVSASPPSAALAPRWHERATLNTQLKRNATFSPSVVTYRLIARATVGKYATRYWHESDRDRPVPVVSWSPHRLHSPRWSLLPCGVGECNLKAII